MSRETTAARAISVIIPTRNRPERLRACLGALTRQTLPRGTFDVIVVDDGSDAPLESVTAPFEQQLDLQLLRQANAGPATARNAGAAAATGTLLAFTDDDCEPEADWLAAMQARALERPGCLIGGHTINALPDNRCSTASQLLIDYLYAYHAASAGTGAAPPFFTSNNFAVPADRFRALGGFDTSFPLAAGEDRELCDRWQRAGHALVSTDAARVRHAHALSLRRFWRQHMNYGRGAWHLRRARLVRGAEAMRIEPWSFYTRLVTYPLASGLGPRALPLMALLGLSQVANVLGFVSERYRRA